MSGPVPATPEQAKGKVRLMVRMQWDTTISSYEVLVPMEEFTDMTPREMFEGYVGPTFSVTLSNLKDRSVERMLVENGVS